MGRTKNSPNPEMFLSYHSIAVTSSWFSFGDKLSIKKINFQPSTVTTVLENGAVLTGWGSGLASSLSSAMAPSPKPCCQLTQIPMSTGTSECMSASKGDAGNVKSVHVGAAVNPSHPRVPPSSRPSPGPDLLRGHRPPR